MNESIDNFNKMADYYDKYHLTHNNLIEIIKDECGTNDDFAIADIGCGTGNETLNIYDNFKCNVYGIEPVENMLKKAMEKSDNIAWLKGTAEEIPLKNNSINIITLFFSIHHILNIGQTVKEFIRILIPTGKIFIFTISHNQMKNSLEYHFFPKLLKYDISRVPSIEFIKNIFAKNGFKVKIIKTDYETRKIDSNYIEMVKSRYRSGFQKLTENEILKGINKIREAILKNKNIIDDIKCYVLICEI